jgi:GntR family transcriptional regulator, transcriptional repressor for pyruvate dehydrogenase complex
MKDAKREIFKPVNPKRTFEDISNQIKNLIYSRELKPNDRLPSERELALQFNTGRMSVREALRILEASGLINVKQGSDGGTFVNELDSKGITSSLEGLFEVGNITLREITETRIAMESLVLELVIKNITKKKLTALESAINRCEDLLDKSGHIPDEMILHELKGFHILLADASGNRLFKYFVKSFAELFASKTDYASDQSLYLINIDHHKTIYKMVKSKDLKKAKKVIGDHLRFVTDHIEKSKRELMH